MVSLPSLILQLLIYLKCISHLILVADCLTSQYGEITTPDGLAVMTIDKPEHCEISAQKGDVISYHYIGILKESAVEFGKSFDYNSPYITTLGQGKIIAGMDRGLVGTCLNERRRLTIPSHLGYGKQGVKDKIPPMSTLVFYITMLNIERNGVPYPASDDIGSLVVSGNNYYNDKEWTACINTYTAAISLFNDFQNKTVECVRRCSNESENHKFNLFNLDAQFLSESIDHIGKISSLYQSYQESACLTNCQNLLYTPSYFKLSYFFIRKLMNKQLHTFISYSYYKTKNYEAGNFHNEIHYYAYPKDEITLNFRDIYKELLSSKKLQEQSIAAMAYDTHRYLYYTEDAYLKKDWSQCLELGNLALLSYKSELAFCRDFCSAIPVHKDESKFEGSETIPMGQVMGEVLICNNECHEGLNFYKGSAIPSILIELLTYLQFCYFQEQRYEEGVTAALTWQALDYHNTIADDAVQYFTKHANINAMLFKPIEEYVELGEMINIEKRLKYFYLNRQLTKKEGTRGEILRDYEDLKKRSIGILRDEL